MKDLLNGVQHLKHSTLKFQAGDKVIYVDPFLIDGEPKDGDIIFITHIHYDHYSPENMKKVAKDGVTIVGTIDVLDAAKKEGFEKAYTVEPSKDYEVEGVKFGTVPAYSINKTFHKKESNWVGYILDINNTTYYITGDTEVIPEMNDIKVDVLFLPVDGIYNMTPGEAATAANTIKPQIAVPIHVGDGIGVSDSAIEFVKLLEPEIKGAIIKE